MRDRFRFQRAAALCTLLLAAAGSASAQGSEGVLRNHFDSDAPAAEPGFFDFAVLGAPGRASWIVVADANPPSPPNQVTQRVPDRPADSIAVAIRRNVSFRDGLFSVALKRASGCGGILFRMASDKDFLVLLVDSRTGETRLISYRGGKPTELALGRAALGFNWGVLGIDASGPDVRATWSGKPLLSAKDPAPAAGRTGLATAGPGYASFDEFILEPASEKPAPPK